jgi:hypothetical protein
MLRSRPLGDTGHRIGDHHRRTRIDVQLRLGNLRHRDACGARSALHARDLDRLVRLHVGAEALSGRRGGRLVMLGTSNHGAFVVPQAFWVVDFLFELSDVDVACCSSVTAKKMIRKRHRAR